MIEVKDRVVQYPSRYQLNAVAGQSNTYDLQAVPGTVLEAGTLVNKALLDQYLAASGTTAGSATALTLAQPGFSLFDGAYIRVKVHTTIKNSVTLNVNGTGAKSLVCTDGSAPYVTSGTYLAAVYSSTTGKYICLTESINFVAGSYTTDAVYPRTIQVGFTPSIVILAQKRFSISGAQITKCPMFLITKDSPVTEGSSSTTNPDNILTITTNGFRIEKLSNFIYANYVSFAWHYVAFR